MRQSNLSTLLAASGNIDVDSSLFAQALDPAAEDDVDIIDFNLPEVDSDVDDDEENERDDSVDENVEIGKVHLQDFYAVNGGVYVSGYA